MRQATWIAGNWKMNHGPAETAQFFVELGELWDEGVSIRARENLEAGALKTALFVPPVSLAASVERSGRHGIQTGAQNAHGKASGAFTGEISGPMLKELGVGIVLLGHSERRTLFGETDAGIRARAEGLLEQGFTVMICVGETREQFESGETLDVLARQVKESVPGSPDRDRVLIAYEPVWAIGTGLVAKAEQIGTAHSAISKLLPGLSVLYGGSVTPANLEEILDVDHVAGALVGGASLKPISYLSMLQVAGTHRRTLKSGV